MKNGVNAIHGHEIVGVKFPTCYCSRVAQTLSSMKMKSSHSPVCGMAHEGVAVGNVGKIGISYYLILVNKTPSVLVDLASYQPLSYSSSWMQRRR